ncbi:MAG: hypothetical protein WCT49_02915 [Candidatus Paceibacterota bacterium]
MSFIVSLVYLISWVVTISALIYLVISLVVSLYAGFILYKEEIFDSVVFSRGEYSVFIGFLLFWLWLAEFCIIQYALYQGHSCEEIAKARHLRIDIVEQVSKWHFLSSFKDQQ